MKDRSAVGAAITGEMTVHSVSKSDEGLYMCVITDVGASAESWLAVRGEMKDWTCGRMVACSPAEVKIFNLLLGNIVFFQHNYLRVFLKLQIQIFFKCLWALFCNI